jgi:hypothetical protein
VFALDHLVLCWQHYYLLLSTPPHLFASPVETCSYVCYDGFSGAYFGVLRAAPAPQTFSLTHCQLIHLLSPLL